MRHQDRIYIQNAHHCIRNKDHLNVSMSSDICVFNKPQFIMYGADKIDTPVYVSDHKVHIIENQTSIDLKFIFTENLQSFVTVGETFKYKIYKFNNSTNVFDNIAKYESDDIGYESFSGTSAFTDSILVSDLSIDGEYLIKGSYDFIMCTEMMSSLGETIDTGIPVIGDEYGIYEPEFDFYFTAIQKASKPIFALSPTDTRTLGALTVESFEMSGQTEVTTTSSWVGSPIVALNGLTMAPEEDYTTVDNTIHLNGPTYLEDIVTISYINIGNPNGLLAESIVVDGPVDSGTTVAYSGQSIYFDTDTGKFEIYLSTNPIEFNDVIVTLNGIMLANGADYYQSVINPRKIILSGLIYSSGDLVDGNVGALADIITMTYNSYGTYAGTILVDTFDINWTATPPPNTTNGKFITLVAEDDTFSTIIFSAETPYIISETSYTVTIDLTGYGGTEAVYKITNQKDYILISGDIISTFTDSEEISIEINL